MVYICQARASSDVHNYCTVPADGYRPVIIMHGIFASEKSMDDLVSMIRSAHPGTDIYNVDAYNDAVRDAVYRQSLVQHAK